jgi:hypothetical protein
MNNEWTLCCNECAMTEPMQPCEACPNREVQDLMKRKDQRELAQYRVRCAKGTHSETAN